MKPTAKQRIERAVAREQCGNKTSGEFLFPDQAIKLILTERARLKERVRRLAKERFAREIPLEFNDILALWEG